MVFSSAMDALRQIILTLTPSEKRYFGVFANAFKTDSGLVKLFELISDKREYNEKELSTKSGIKNIPEGRSSLRSLLFKAMRNYHEDATIRQQLRDVLSNIEFLERKKLKDEARKEIKKGLKLALEHDEFLPNSDLLEKWARNMDTGAKPGQVFDNLLQIQEQLEFSIAESTQSLRTKMISCELTAIINSASFTSPQQIEIMSGELKARILALLPLVKTPHTRIHLLAMFIFCDNDGSNSAPYCEEVVALYEQYPALAARDPFMYWTFLFTYCRQLVLNPENRERAADLIRKMEAVPVEHRDFFRGTAKKLLRMNRKLLSVKLNFYNTNRQWNLWKEMEQEVKLDLANAEGEEDTLKAINVCKVVMGFYNTGDYEKALEWVKIFYSQPESNQRKPVMIAVRVYEAFAFFKLKQFDIGVNMATNIYKTISEQQYKDEYHKNLGTVLRKLYKWDLHNPTDRAEMDKLTAGFESLKRNNDLTWQTYRGLLYPEDMLREVLQ